MTTMTQMVAVESARVMMTQAELDLRDRIRYAAEENKFLEAP